MAQCPNCGAQVGDQAVQCQSCGASLGVQQGGQQQPQGGQQQGGQQPQGGQQQPQDSQYQRGGQQPQGGQHQQGGQQPQGGQHQQRGQQPPHGQQAQQPPGQPSGGPGRGGNPGGTSRRELLMYGGGAAAVAVGGYFAYETFLGDSGPDGPEGVARAYAKALIDGNEDEMENLVHSDAPNRVQLTQSDGTGSNDQFSVSISSAELLNEGEETATVEVTLAFRGEFQGETINEETTAEIELRTENGNWRIYSITNTSI